jgi:hypothetical protein
MQSSGWLMSLAQEQVCPADSQVHAHKQAGINIRRFLEGVPVNWLDTRALDCCVS